MKANIGSHTTSNARLYHLPPDLSNSVSNPDHIKSSIDSIDSIGSIGSIDSIDGIASTGSTGSTGSIYGGIGSITDSVEVTDNGDHGDSYNGVVDMNGSSSSSCSSSSSSSSSLTGPHYGRILDSPGIRELGIWHLARPSILTGFKEIAFYAEKCKFRNCRHSEEEAKYCGVRKAVSDGLIEDSRFQSYYNLVADD